MPIAYIGLGSNLGHRARFLSRAVDEIRRSPCVEVLSTSSLYETEPVGVTSQPWFLNAVAEVKTDFRPEGLLAFLHKIEDTMGRRRPGRWGPRRIDLDILLYDDLILRTAELVIPHPELHRRRFVLVPLAEVAGPREHPVFHKTVRTLLDELEGKESVRLLASSLQWRR